MVQYTSAQGKISFEEENTFGVDPASTRDFLGILISFDHSYTKNPNPIRGIGSRNIRQIIELGTNVEATMEVQCQNYHWAYMALGGGTLTAPSESNSLPSFTFERTLDNTDDITFIYTGCVLNTCEVSCSEDDVITASLSFTAAKLFRKDAAAATHAVVDSDRVSGFYDARLWVKGNITKEWIFDGDGTTRQSVYCNHIPLASPTPEVYVRTAPSGVITDTAQGVTTGTITDPSDGDITTGKCYVNTATGEITFKTTEVPPANTEIFADYSFAYEEISAKTQSVSFNINNNLSPVRGLGSKTIRQLAPGGRDYTGSCTFYTQGHDQIDWVAFQSKVGTGTDSGEMTNLFQNDLTMKVVITFGATAKTFEFDNVAFGENSEAWSEADIVTDEMAWQADSLVIN